MTMTTVELIALIERLGKKRVIKNGELMTYGEIVHWLWENNTEYRRRTIEGSKKARTNPDYLQLISDITTNGWRSPQIRQKHEEAVRTPEYRRDRSELAKRLWNDPQHIQLQTERRTESWKRTRQKRVEGQKRGWMNAERKKVAASRMSNNNPMHNPESLEKFKIRIIGRRRKYRSDGTWYWHK